MQVRDLIQALQRPTGGRHQMRRLHKIIATAAGAVTAGAVALSLVPSSAAATESASDCYAQLNAVRVAVGSPSAALAAPSAARRTRQSSRRCRNASSLLPPAFTPTAIR